MGLLKFGVCVVTWILCASKTSGNNTTLLNSELECVEGQDLPSAGPCNKCVCTQGKVVCIDVECDLEPKQNATKLGPERNSMHDNIRPPENDLKGLLSDQIDNKLSIKNDLPHSSPVTTKEGTAIETIETNPNITVLLKESHAEDAINKFLTHNFGSDDKYILIFPEMPHKIKHQVKRDISSIPEIRAHKFNSEYGLQRAQPGTFNSKQPIYRSKRADNMFTETQGIQSSSIIDDNAAPSSIVENNVRSRLTKRSNQYEMLQPLVNNNFNPYSQPDVPYYNFNQYGYNNPYQYNFNNANSFNSYANVNTPKPMFDQSVSYKTQNDIWAKPNKDETIDNAEQSTDSSESKNKKSFPQKVYDHLSNFVSSFFDKPSKNNDEDNNQSYNDDITTPETTIQNDDYQMNNHQIMKPRDIPLSIEPAYEAQINIINQNDPLYHSETNDINSLTSENFPNQPTIQNNDEIFHDSLSVYPEVTQKPILNFDAEIDNTPISNDDPLTHKNPVSELQIYIKDKDIPNDMVEMITPVPVKIPKKPVDITPSPLIDYTNKPRKPFKIHSHTPKNELKLPLPKHHPKHDKSKIQINLYPSVLEHKTKAIPNSEHNPQKPFVNKPIKPKLQSEESNILFNKPKKPLNVVIQSLNNKPIVHPHIENTPPIKDVYPQQLVMPVNNYQSFQNVIEPPSTIKPGLGFQPKKIILQINDEPENYNKLSEKPYSITSKKPSKKYPMQFKPDISQSPAYEYSDAPQILDSLPNQYQDIPKKPTNLLVQIPIEEKKLYVNIENAPVTNKYPLSNKKPTTGGKFYPQKNKIPHKMTANINSKPKQFLQIPKEPVNLNIQIISDKEKSYPEHENVPIIQKHSLNKRPSSDNALYPKKVTYVAHILKPTPKLSPFKPKEYVSPNVVVVEPDFYPGHEEIPKLNNYKPLIHKNPVSESAFNPKINKIPTDNMLVTFQKPSELETYPEYDNYALSDNNPLTSTNPFSDSPLRPKKSTNLKLKIIYDNPNKFHGTDSKSLPNHYVKLPIDANSEIPLVSYDEPDIYPGYEETPVTYSLQENSEIENYIDIENMPTEENYAMVHENPAPGSGTVMKPKMNSKLDNIPVTKITAIIEPHSNVHFDSNNLINDYEPAGYQNIENMPKANYEGDISTNKIPQAFGYIPEQPYIPKKSTDINLYVFDEGPQMYSERDDTQIPINDLQTHPNSISEYPENFMPQDFNSIPKQFPQTLKKQPNITVQILNSDPGSQPKSAKASFAYNKPTNGINPYPHEPIKSTNVTLYLLNDKPDLYPDPAETLKPGNDLQIYKSAVTGGPLYTNSNVPQKMNTMAKRYSQPHKRRSNISLQILNRGPEINSDYEQMHKNSTSTSTVYRSKYKRLTSTLKQIFDDELDTFSNKIPENSSKEKTFTSNLKQLLISIIKKYLDISKEEDDNTKILKDTDINTILNNNPQTYKQPASENLGKGPINKPPGIYKSVPTQYSMKPAGSDDYTPKVFKNKPNSYLDYKNNLNPTYNALNYKKPVHFKPKHYSHVTKKPNGSIPKLFDKKPDVYQHNDNSPIPTDYPWTFKKPSTISPFDPMKVKTPVDKLSVTLSSKPTQLPHKIKKPHGYMPALFDSEPEMYSVNENRPKPTSNIPEILISVTTHTPKSPYSIKPEVLDKVPETYSDYKNSPNPTSFPLTDTESPFYPNKGVPIESLPVISDFKSAQNPHLPEKPNSLMPEIFDNEPELNPDYNNGQVTINYPLPSNQPAIKNPLYPTKGISSTDELPGTLYSKPKQNPLHPKLTNGIVPKLSNNYPNMNIDYENSPIPSDYLITPKKPYSGIPIYPNQGTLKVKVINKLSSTFNAKPKQHPYKPKHPYDVIPDPHNNEMYPDSENSPIPTNYPWAPQNPHGEIPLYPGLGKKPDDILPETLYSKPKEYTNRPKKPHSIIPDLQNKETKVLPELPNSLITTKVTVTTTNPDGERPLSYDPKKPYSLTPEAYNSESQIYPEYDIDPIPDNYDITPKKPHSGNPFYPKHGKRPKNKMPITFDSNPKQYPHKSNKPFSLKLEIYDKEPKTHPDYENGPKSPNDPFTSNNPNSERPFYPKKSKRPTEMLPKIFDSKPEHPLKPKKPYGLVPELYNNGPNTHPDYDNGPISPNDPFTPNKPYSERPFYPKKSKRPTDMLPETFDSKPGHPLKPKKPYGLMPELYDSEPKANPDYDNSPISPNDPFTPNKPNSERPFYPKKSKRPTDMLPKTFDPKPEHPLKPKKPYGLVPELYNNGPNTHPDYDNGPMSPNGPFTPNKPYSERPFYPKKSKRPIDMLPKTFDSKPGHPLKPKKPYGLVSELYNNEPKMNPDYDNSPISPNNPFTPNKPNSERPFYPKKSERPTDMLPKPFDSKPGHPSRPKKPYGLVIELYNNEPKPHPDYDNGPISPNNPFTPNNPNRDIPFHPKKSKSSNDMLPKTFDSKPGHPLKPKKPYALVPELYNNEPKTHPDYDNGPISPNDQFKSNKPNSEGPFNPKKNKRPNDMLPKTFDSKPGHPLKPKKPYGLGSVPELYNNEPKMYPDYDNGPIPPNDLFTPNKPNSEIPFYPKNSNRPTDMLPELYDSEPKTYPDYNNSPISPNDPFAPNNPNSERPSYPKKSKSPTDMFPKTFDSKPEHPLTKPYGFNPELLDNDSKTYPDYEYNPNYPLTKNVPGGEIPFNPNLDQKPTGNLPITSYSNPKKYPYKEPDDLSQALIIIESDTYLDEKNNPGLYIYPSAIENSDPFHPNNDKKPTSKHPNIFGSSPKQYPQEPKKPDGIIPEIFDSETVTYPDYENSAIPAGKLPEMFDPMPNQLPQTYKDADGLSLQIITNNPQIYPDYENDPGFANYPLTPEQSNSESPFNPSKNYNPKNKLPHKFNSEANPYSHKLKEPYVVTPEILNGELEIYLDSENTPMQINYPLSTENPGDENSENPLYSNKGNGPTSDIPLHTPLLSSNPENYPQQSIGPDGLSPDLVIIESDMYLEDKNNPMSHIYPVTPENPANGRPIYSNKLKKPIGNIELPLTTESGNYPQEYKVPSDMNPDLVIIESDIYLGEENNPIPTNDLLSPETFAGSNPYPINKGKSPTKLPVASIPEQYPHKPKGLGLKPQVFNNEANQYPEYKDIPMPSNYALNPSDPLDPSQGTIPTSGYWLPQDLNSEPEQYPHKPKGPHDFTPGILNSDLKTPFDYENDPIPTNYPLIPENSANGIPFYPKKGKIPASKLPNIFDSILNNYPDQPKTPGGLRPLIFIIETDLNSDYGKKPKYPITPKDTAIESPFYPKKEEKLKSIIIEVLTTLAKQYSHDNNEPTDVPNIYKDKAENNPDYEFIVITDDSYIRPGSQIADYPSTSHPTDIDTLCRECTKLHCCTTMTTSNTDYPIYSDSPYQSLNAQDGEYDTNSLSGNNYEPLFQFSEPLNNEEPQHIPDIISDNDNEPRVEYVIPVSDSTPLSLSESYEPPPYTSGPVEDLTTQYIPSSVTENNDKQLYISITPVDHEEPNHFLGDSQKIPHETIRPLNDKAPQININIVSGNNHELPFESYEPFNEKPQQYESISFSDKSFEQPLPYTRPYDDEKTQYNPDTSFGNSHVIGESPVQFVGKYDYDQPQYIPNTIIDNNAELPLTDSKTSYENSQYVPNSFADDNIPLDTEQNHILDAEITDVGSIPRGWHNPDILPDLDYDLPYLTMPAYDNLLEQIPHEKVRDLMIPPFEYYINQKGPHKVHKKKHSKNKSGGIGSLGHVEPRLEHFKDKQDIALNAMKYPWQKNPIQSPGLPKPSATSSSGYDDNLVTYIDTKVRNNEPKRFYSLRGNGKLDRFGKPQLRQAWMDKLKEILPKH